MPYTDFANAICHKTQAAAQAMVQARITANNLESLLPTASVFAGIQIGPVTAVRVVCECKNAVPNLPWEGNWDADLSIKVIAPYAEFDTAEDFHNLAGQIFAFFFQAREDVCTRLSNATIKYTAQFIIPRRQSWDIENQSAPHAEEPSLVWVSQCDFQVLCCGSVVE